MKNIYLIVFICLIMLPDAWAHKVSIRGVVYGKDTNTPLAGATVMLTNVNKTSTTDVFGVYTFSGLVAGKYDLKISYLGYEQSSSVVEVDNQSISKVTTHLQIGSVKLSEIAVSASQTKPLNIISALDLQVRPIQNSQEILKLIPGLFIAQHAGGGKAEQIFLRGFDIDHGTDINLTADGMPVNMVSHAHGQGYSDLHFLIPETIQGVDYGKGPYQAGKGNFATAGYADFRTKSSLPASSIKLEGGRFDTYRALGMFNLLGESARQKQQNAYVATEYLFSNGYVQLPQNLNRLNIFGRYQGIFKDNTIINASVSAFRSKWDASGQIPERAVAQGIISRLGAIDSTEGGNTARYNANVSLEKILPNAAVLRNQAYLIKYDFELYSNFTFFLNDTVNGDQIRQKENRIIYGYQGTYEKESLLGNKPLRHEVGIGIRYDQVKDSELSRTKYRATTISPVSRGDIDEINTFAYLNETWEISNRLKINAALRFDQIYFKYINLLESNPQQSLLRNSRNRLSPKLNITYTHSPATQLYLSSGQGFHSNDTRVSVLPAHREILPVAKGADLGINFKPTGRLYINSALWFLHLQQELVYVGDEGIVEPSGKTRRYGLDFSARYQITDFLFADADINLAKPRLTEAGRGSNYIPLAPLVSSTGGILYKNNKGLKSSLRYRFLGNRPANEENSIQAKGYFLLDAAINYTRKNIEYFVAAENVGNVEWKEAQFDTESRLRNEIEPVSEIHFTPGTPFFLKAGLSFSFNRANTGK